MTTFHLHVDGPYSDDNTQQTAHALPEVVRALNHATQRRDAITAPATINAVLGDLHTTTQRMDQLLGQLTDRLAAFAADPRIADTDCDPQAPIASALAQLDVTRVYADGLATRLNAAFNNTSGLYLHDDGDDEGGGR